MGGIETCACVFRGNYTHSLRRNQTSNLRGKYTRCFRGRQTCCLGGNQRGNYSCYLRSTQAGYLRGKYTRRFRRRQTCCLGGNQRGNYSCYLRSTQALSLRSIQTCYLRGNRRDNFRDIHTSSYYGTIHRSSHRSMNTSRVRSSSIMHVHWSRWDIHTTWSHSDCDWVSKWRMCMMTGHTSFTTNNAFWQFMS